MSLLALLLVVSGLLGLGRAAMSDQDCGEGRVRDLDGTCVKKVIIHKETKPVCPKLSIDNGNIFLFGGESRGGREGGEGADQHPSPGQAGLTTKHHQNFLFWLCSCEDH